MLLQISNRKQERRLVIAEEVPELRIPFDEEFGTDLEFLDVRLRPVIRSIANAPGAKKTTALISVE
ncbi:hypothetical protein C482_00220 [Natrialba chahannaoensis JCM 10990]|uniref:Uncharacterized protein n=1 Tax=Natrialba chahannaoensis JCM 10990 TaxID=1227492 RepID=M0B5W0_9EURY|nr:hypothetical protein C482_00220 [Natrialba chahannaoensis JCM 10990]